MPIYRYQTLPNPNYNDISDDDTRLSWLQGTETNYTWIAHPETGEPVGVEPAHPDPYTGHIGLRISEAEFQAFKRLTRFPTAPIWPGPTHCDVDEPIVLTETTIITAPMDGILLTIDEVAPGAGKWGVDDFASYYRAGYVVFFSPEGHADVTQFIGPSDNVFTPKGMTTAGSVVVALNRAAQITVTPWSLRRVT